MKLTQHQKILKVLRDADGGWVSTRILKQQHLISECNGRISELRAKGFKIETSEHRDEYGFAYHRLIEEPAPLPLFN